MKLRVMDVAQLPAQAQRERRAGTRSKATSFVWGLRVGAAAARTRPQRRSWSAPRMVVTASDVVRWALAAAAAVGERSAAP
jgi:hypothetical protein